MSNPHRKTDPNPFPRAVDYTRPSDDDVGAAVDLIALWDSQAEWSQATFGSDETRGPAGALKHLQLEAAEAIVSTAAGEPAAAAVEVADCLLLTLDAARRSGLTFAELVRVAAAKHETNKARTWTNPTSDEPVFHVRGADEPPAVETHPDTVRAVAAERRVDVLERAIRKISRRRMDWSRRIVGASVVMEEIALSGRQCR